MDEVIYKSEWVYINAYFYTFWMKKSELKKNAGLLQG